MKNEEKSKNDKDVVIIKASKKNEGNAEKDLEKQPPQVEKELTTIRRMLGTLDRILTKQFILILGLCTAVISVCTVGLVFASGIVGNAHSAGGPVSSSGNLTIQTWLFSIIGLCVFIMLVACAYTLSKKKKKRA